MGKSYINWELFRKAIYGKLNGVENIEFEQWLRETPANRKYFENARKVHLEKDLSIIEDAEVSDKGWDEFKSRIKIRKRKVNISYLQKIAAFAVVAVFILVSGNQIRKYNDSLSKLDQNSIEPGRSLARLMVEGRNDILLENTDTVFGLDKSSSLVSVKSGIIHYESYAPIGIIKPVLNRLIIPRGGEYMVTLPDGSNMWVNSETVVEYYVPFIDKRREVFVSGGEICLEVKKDSLHPFMVETSEYSVQVFGTTFNVSAYPGDNFITTTLVEGSIEVTNIDGQTSLRQVVKPNQQFLFDKTSSETEIREVVASVYTEWTRGFFVFENERLYSIFNKLKRWYDIDVFFFSEEAENEYFTGKLPRFDSLEEILELLNSVSLSKIELKGNTVSIK